MPLNIIRRLVSGQKKRFQDGPDGFDLDLAYIAPRIIAMGLPAVQGKEVLYRNPMQEIARFLQTYHSGHAKVYNLCSEHKYSAQHLAVALQQYPFDDHQTPPLAMVQQFCTDAAAWLAADPAHVVVVHCKAGKGRTGVMICCLLLYLHKNAPDLANLTAAAAKGLAVLAGSAFAPVQPHSAAAEQQQAPIPVQDKACPASLNSSERASQRTASKAQHNSNSSAGQHSSSGSSTGQHSSRQWHPWQSVPPVQLQQLDQPVRDILGLYAERRTHDGNGVAIHSQRRYIAYFWAVLCSSPGPIGSLPKPRTVQIRRVSISGLPAGTADSCVLLVEARPSGSLAPRGSRVCLRAAPRASGGGASGLCMVPCAHAPVMQEEDSCSISSDASGDTLTFKMPAASLGLSTLPHSSSTAAHTAPTGHGGPGRPPHAAAAGCAAVQGMASNERSAHTAHAVSGADDAVDFSTAGAPGCCMVCGTASSSSCCACTPAAGDLPGSVPSHESHGPMPGGTCCQPQAAGNACHGSCDGPQYPSAGPHCMDPGSGARCTGMCDSTPCSCAGHTSRGGDGGSQGVYGGSQGACGGTPHVCDAHSSGGSACADPVLLADAWEPTVEDGCCVVEGDVRLMVLRGSTRLFHTWFNTAFLSLSGSFSLSRGQLDKPNKALPHGVSLSVRFVDMQPTAEADDIIGPALPAQLPGQAQHLQVQQSQQQHRFSTFQDLPYDGGLPLPQQALKLPAQQDRQQQGRQQQDRQQQHLQQDKQQHKQQHKQAGGMLAAGSWASTQQPSAGHALGAAYRAQGSQMQPAALQGHVCFAGTDVNVKQQPSAVKLCAGVGSTAEPGAAAAKAAAAQQQQQHWHCSAVSDAAPAAGAAAAAPISSSAPASPQERKLRSSGSWRQHLPAISSISTSALEWGSSAEATLIPQQQQAEQHQRKSVSQQGSKRTSPGSWCGPAGRSWDWESLAAADEGSSAFAAAAGTAEGPVALQHVGLLSEHHAASGAGGFATSGSGGKDVSSSWQGKAAGYSAHAVAHAGGVQQQPIQWRSSWVQGKQRGGLGTSTNSRGSSGGAMEALPQGLYSTAQGSSGVHPNLVPTLAAAQASIELPVIVKRPSGVDSLVDALLDPEHSVGSQTSTTAAAAAAASAASGRVLASEASSSAVAGQRPTTGVKPPSQLRKGYSWHGNTGWFTAKTAAMNSSTVNCSSSSGSTAAVSSSNQPGGATASRPQPQVQDQAGGSVWGGGLGDVWGDNLAAAESAVLDLDPLLPSRMSADVPGSALGSCSDPLQGLLEALNWSTDMQRYQQPGGQQYRRTSSSSEPCSPRRPRGRLPNALSSPLLQSCKSAPVTPCAATQSSIGPPAAAAAAECIPQGQDTEVSAGSMCGTSSSEYFGNSRPGLTHRGLGQGSSSSSSSGRRRRRGPRADVCRLLDLEEWVEEEADGVDTYTRRATGPGPADTYSHSPGSNSQASGAGDGRTVAAAAATASTVPASLAAGAPVSPARGQGSSGGKQEASAANLAGSSSKLQGPSSGSGNARLGLHLRSSDPGGAASSSTRGVSLPGGSARGGLWESSAGLKLRSAARQAKPNPAGPTPTAPPAARSTPTAAGSSAKAPLGSCGVVDEALLGLLAAEGAAAAPSCAAEAAPVVVQQWQQLEKAWQRSWWV